MKKLKNKKLLRKPGRAGRTGTTKSVMIDYTRATTDLINTLFRTVLRNVNNGTIDHTELPVIATIVPMLIIKHFYKGTTCDSFCEMVSDNWSNIEEDITKNIGSSQHFAVHTDKTSTLDDE